MSWSVADVAVTFASFGIPTLVLVAASLALHWKFWSFRYSNVFLGMSGLAARGLFRGTLLPYGGWLPARAFAFTFGSLLALIALSPHILLLVWGLSVATGLGASVAGAAILCVGNALLLLVMGLLAGHATQWRLSGGRRGVLRNNDAPAMLFVAVAFFAAFALYAVVRAKTYLGMSWLFFALNMMPMIYAAFVAGKGRNDPLDVAAPGESASGAEQGAAKDGEKEAKEPEPGRLTRTCQRYSAYVAYAIAFLILLIYAVLNALVAEPQYRRLGWLTSAAVLTSDILAALLWRSGYLTSPMYATSVMLLSRTGLLAFGADLWYLGHCAMYILYATVLSTMAIDKRIYIRNFPPAAEEEEDDEGAGGHSDVTLRGSSDEEGGSGTAGRGAASAEEVEAEPLEAERCRALSGPAFPLAFLTTLFLILLIVVASTNIAGVPPGPVLWFRGSQQFFEYGIAALFTVVILSAMRATQRVHQRLQRIEAQCTAPAQGRRSEGEEDRAAESEGEREGEGEEGGSHLARSYRVEEVVVEWLGLTHAVNELHRRYQRLFFGAAAGTSLLVIVAGVVLYAIGQWTMWLALCLFGPPFLAALAAGHARWVANDYSFFVPPQQAQWRRPELREAHCCQAFWCLGWPQGDYVTITALSVASVCLIGYGAVVATSAWGWIGPAAAGAVVVLLASGVAVEAHFNLLKWTPLAITAAAVAVTSHLLLHILVMALQVSDWSSGFAAAVLASFVGWPMLMLTGTALYKWRDDGWKLTRFTLGMLLTAQALIVAGAIAIGVTVSWYWGAALGMAYLLFATATAAMISWVKHRFYLNKLWRFVLGAMLVLVTVAAIAVSLTASSTNRRFAGFSVAYGILYTLLLLYTVRYTGVDKRFAAALWASASPASVRDLWWCKPHALNCYRYDEATGQWAYERRGVLLVGALLGAGCLWGILAVTFLHSSLTFLGVGFIAVMAVAFAALWADAVSAPRRRVAGAYEVLLFSDPTGSLARRTARQALADAAVWEERLQSSRVEIHKRKCRVVETRTGRVRLAGAQQASVGSIVSGARPSSRVDDDVEGGRAASSRTLASREDEEEAAAAMAVARRRAHLWGPHLNCWADSRKVKASDSAEKRYSAILAARAHDWYFDEAGRPAASSDEWTEPEVEPREGVEAAVAERDVEMLQGSEAVLAAWHKLSVQSRLFAMRSFVARAWEMEQGLNAEFAALIRWLRQCSKQGGSGSEQELLDSRVVRLLLSMESAPPLSSVRTWPARDRKVIRRARQLHKRWKEEQDHVDKQREREEEEARQRQVEALAKRKEEERKRKEALWRAKNEEKARQLEEERRKREAEEEERRQREEQEEQERKRKEEQEEEERKRRRREESRKRAAEAGAGQEEEEEEEEETEEEARRRRIQEARERRLEQIRRQREKREAEERRRRAEEQAEIEQEAEGEDDEEKQELELREQRREDPWMDEAFTGMPALYSDPDGGKPEVEWEMARQMFGEGVKVVDRYNPADIHQGALGDCYLLSALSIMAQHPDLLDSVLMTKEANPEGIYKVQLYVDGKWKRMLLDERFPARRGQPLYARTPRDVKELWVMLLEKAYAKLHGNYEVIEGGFVSVALVHLTGGISELHNMHNKTGASKVASGEMWRELLEMHQAGHLIGCGSTSGKDTHVVDGIAQGHAYAVLRVAEESDSRGTHRLLQLRNPWGHTEWTGKWGDEDLQSWSARMRAKLEYEPEREDKNDGVFWMSFDDFVHRFRNIYVCKLCRTVEQGGRWHRYSNSAEWRGETAGGIFNTPTAYHNPQFLLKVTVPTTVVLTIQVGMGAPSGLCMLAGVFRKDGKRMEKCYQGDRVATTPFTNLTMLSCEVKLEPYDPGYTVFACTAKAGEEAPFVLTVFADQPLADAVEGEGGSKSLQPLPSK